MQKNIMKNLFFKSLKALLVSFLMLVAWAFPFDSFQGVSLHFSACDFNSFQGQSVPSRTSINDGSQETKGSNKSEKEVEEEIRKGVKEEQKESAQIPNLFFNLIRITRGGE